MNPSQEQDQTASNVFTEGELSEEDLIKMAGGVIHLGVEGSFSNGKFYRLASVDV